MTAKIATATISTATIAAANATTTTKKSIPRSDARRADGSDVMSVYDATKTRRYVFLNPFGPVLDTVHQSDTTFWSRRVVGIVNICIY